MNGWFLNPELLAPSPGVRPVYVYGVKRCLVLISLKRGWRWSSPWKTREEDPWVFLNTPGTYYVCPCRSLLRRLRTHPRAQAPRFSRLINRTELSGLRGTALLIQKLVTVTPAQKHFLGSNSQLLLSLINLQPAKCPLTLRLTTWTLTRRPPGQGMPELFTIIFISQGCNSEWLAVQGKTKQYFGSPRV